MVTGGDYTYGTEHFVMYIIIKSLCCPPETNMICQLYFSLKINKKKSLRVWCFAHLSWNSSHLNRCIFHGHHFLYKPLSRWCLYWISSHFPMCLILTLLFARVLLVNRWLPWSHPSEGLTYPFVMLTVAVITLNFISFLCIFLNNFLRVEVIFFTTMSLASSPVSVLQSIFNKY